MHSFDLSTANSALLVVDVQERFVPTIPAIAPGGECLRNCAQLMTAAKLLGVPTVITEQYPKGLGTTVPQLQAINARADRFAKTHFSCMEDTAIAERVEALSRNHVVLCGIETHVCVLSTASDLLRRGYWVVVAADAVASRKDESRTTALAAVRDMGGLVLPTESIVFRWQRQAGVGCFKELIALIK
jgi:nicotinamidase-related amidase